MIQWAVILVVLIAIAACWDIGRRAYLSREDRAAIVALRAAVTDLAKLSAEKERELRDIVRDTAIGLRGEIRAAVPVKISPALPFGPKR